MWGFYFVEGPGAFGGRGDFYHPGAPNCNFHVLTKVQILFQIFVILISDNAYLYNCFIFLRNS